MSTKTTVRKSLAWLTLTLLASSTAIAAGARLAVWEPESEEITVSDDNQWNSHWDSTEWSIQAGQEGHGRSKGPVLRHLTLAANTESAGSGAVAAYRLGMENARKFAQAQSREILDRSGCSSLPDYEQALGQFWNSAFRGFPDMNANAIAYAQGVIKEIIVTLQRVRKRCGSQAASPIPESPAPSPAPVKTPPTVVDTEYETAYKLGVEKTSQMAARARAQTLDSQGCKGLRSYEKALKKMGQALSQTAATNAADFSRGFKAGVEDELRKLISEAHRGC